MPKYLITVRYDIMIDAPTMRKAADKASEGLPQGSQISAMRAAKVAATEEAG